MEERPEMRTSKSGSKNAAVEYRSLPDVDTTYPVVGTASEQYVHSST